MIKSGGKSFAPRGASPCIDMSWGLWYGIGDFGGSGGPSARAPPAAIASAMKQNIHRKRREPLFVVLPQSISIVFSLRDVTSIMATLLWYRTSEHCEEALDQGCRAGTRADLFLPSRRSGGIDGGADSSLECGYLLRSLVRPRQ